MWKAFFAVLGVFASVIAIYQFVSGNTSIHDLAHSSTGREASKSQASAPVPTLVNDVSKFTPLLRVQNEGSDVVTIIAYESSSPAHIARLTCQKTCTSRRLVGLSKDLRLVDTVALDNEAQKFVAVGRNGKGFIFDLGENTYTQFSIKVPCAENGASSGTKFTGPTKVSGGKFFIQEATYSDGQLSITVVAANCNGTAEIGSNLIRLKTPNVFLVSFWQLKITMAFDDAGLISSGDVETIRFVNESVLAPEWFRDAVQWSN